MGGPPLGVLVPGEHRGGPWRTDQDTADMLEEAARLAGTTWLVFQGSWHDGSVSGGTHSGTAVVDVWPKDGDAEKAVACLRQVGAFAWVRHPPRFEWHIHAGRVGAIGMDPTADQQAAWYLEGLNGLWPPSQAPDDGPRTYVGVTWDRYKEDNTMSGTQVEAILAALTAQAKVDADRYEVDAARYRDIAARGQRTEAALQALAAGLGPTVEKAVADALADVVVNVDIDVAGTAVS